MVAGAPRGFDTYNERGEGWLVPLPHIYIYMYVFVCECVPGRRRSQLFPLPPGASLLTKREHLSKSPILWATFDV